PRPR
ncbi:Cytoplasmic protein, partial [Monkeypox virus]